MPAWTEMGLQVAEMMPPPGPAATSRASGGDIDWDSSASTRSLSALGHWEGDKSIGGVEAVDIPGESRVDLFSVCRESASVVNVVRVRLFVYILPGEGVVY